MIARHTFGGEFETQTWIGLVALATTVSAALAYYNIRKRQIEQHKAWMLRTWFYAASIITLRIIMIISALIISSEAEELWRAVRCEAIAFSYQDKKEAGLETDSPDCIVSGRLQGDRHVPIKAEFTTSVKVGVALNVTFGTAGWLREVSLMKQRERRYKDAGSAGLVVERLGDADPWTAPREEAVGGKVGQPKQDDLEE